MTTPIDFGNGSQAVPQERRHRKELEAPRGRRQERGKTNTLWQGRGKTNSAVAMNSPNQAIFFLIKFVTSNSITRAMES